MNTYHQFHGLRPSLAAVFLSAVLLFLGTAAAYGHGGKTHADEPFSAFQAVQKATQLYDRLIVSGKLPEDWETSLSSIHVTVRGAVNSPENVVQFKRSGGDPDRVRPLESEIQYLLETRNHYFEKPLRREDVIDLVKILYEAVGGQKYYKHQPAEIKAICRGLKRSLILANFRTAGQLREYLETLEWQ